MGLQKSVVTLMASLVITAVRNGGFAIGPGSEANGANGHKGGIAIGPGSDANGG